MSIRTVKTLRNRRPDGTDVSVRVIFDDDWEEYQCHLMVNGASRLDATHHTDDRDDALGTAKHMLENGV